MRIIAGWVKPTPTRLLVLSGIAPAEKLRRNYATNKISYHACANKERPLHSLVPNPQSLRPQRMKSRHPFYRLAAEHHNCDHDIIEAWNEEWTKHQRPKQLTLTLDTTTPPESDLPRKLWVTLNRLRAGVGRFGEEMHKWDSEHQPHVRAELPPKMQSTSCLIAISFVHLTPPRTSLT